MGKKKKKNKKKQASGASPDAPRSIGHGRDGRSDPAPDAPEELLLLRHNFQAGNYVATRRLARQLTSQDNPEPVREEAARLLSLVALDPPTIGIAVTGIGVVIALGLLILT